jgi:hypothetical protein
LVAWIRLTTMTLVAVALMMFARIAATGVV